MPEDTNSREALEAMSGATPQQQQQTQQPAKQAAIDWSSVNVDDIPADVLKQHPLYREVLAESITRRQTIAQLKAALGDNAPQSGAQPAQPAKQAEDDRLAALQEMVNQLTSRIEQDAKARVERTRALAIETYGIPAELHDMVVGETEDEILARAKKLGTFIVPQPHKGSTPVGNTNSATNADDELLSKVKARLTGADVQNVFAPGVQRTMGGGPISK